MKNSKPQEDKMFENILRHVEFENKYRLLTWDTNKTDSMGKYKVGYQFYKADTGEVIFSGEDFCCSPLHAIDSNECLRSLMTFITLRPGDTDKEYFENYTPEQMEFAENEAEYLSMWALEDDEVLEYYNNIEVK
jgi:hypothetical protein